MGGGAGVPIHPSGDSTRGVTCTHGYRMVCSAAPFTWRYGSPTIPRMGTAIPLPTPTASWLFTALHSVPPGAVVPCGPSWGGPAMGQARLWTGACKYCHGTRPGGKIEASMRIKGTAFVLLAGFVTALAGARLAHAQTPQSLGEIALKEQERRKALKAAGKVLSNADLPKIPSATTPKTLPEGGAVKPEAAQQPAAAKPPQEERDEAWWRQRMGQLREELRRNELFAEALQTRINSLTND